MEIRWLQDFLAVAEAGNFTVAAEARGVSQAAFSRRIQSLENWLGAQLIDRSAFPTRLTPEGERFRDHAAEIVREALTARADLQGLPQRLTDTVRIAMPHTLATVRFAEWWVAWGAEGRVRCHVEPLNVHDSVSAFVAGSVDLLISFDQPEQPVRLDGGRYETVRLGAESFGPYASPALATQETFTLQGRPGYPTPFLAYAPGTYLGLMADIAVARGGDAIHLNRVAESTMGGTLAALAAAGCGVAWLPACVADGFVARRELMPVGDGAWSVQLPVVACRSLERTKPSIDRLWRMIMAAHGEEKARPSSRRLNGFLAGRERRALADTPPPSSSAKERRP